MVFIISGIDYTPFTEEKSYTVSYEVREGPNSGMSLDGSIIRDVIAYKAVISWELNALSADKLAELLREVLTDYITVTYFDTRMNAERTAQFIPSIGGQGFAFRRRGINYFRAGTKLTLRER